MIKMIVRRTLCLLVAVSLCIGLGANVAAQNSPDGDLPARHPDAPAGLGAFVDSVFTNDWLGITFVLPEGWEIMEQFQLLELLGKIALQDWSEETWVPLFEIESQSDGGESVTAMLSAHHIVFENWESVRTPEDYLARMIKSQEDWAMEEGDSTYTYGEIGEVVVSGKTFFTLSDRFRASYYDSCCDTYVHQRGEYLFVYSVLYTDQHGSEMGLESLKNLTIR